MFYEVKNSSGDEKAQILSARKQRKETSVGAVCVTCGVALGKTPCLDARHM